VIPPHALSSEAAIGDVVRGAIGARATVRVTEWHVRRDNYVVVAVETEHPALRLIVKLEEPGERPNRHFDAMAAIAQLVRRQTAVPTFDVVAVDVTRQRWPWEYLIVTQLPGLTWMQLYPGLDPDARAVAQRQIGRAAGQLHALRFDAFGQIDGDGSVIQGTRMVPALAQRARRRLTTPRYLELFLELLDVHRDRFAELLTPTLCHEDLNPNNLVFALRDGRPALVGILDFESAWASTGESDLARLELWWMSAGVAVREGYQEVAPLAAGYAARRPLLQLLWCLEYAQFHNAAKDQAVLHQVCDELAIARIH
jgi:Ser/Thr protein kinase RdoA (MazF antagonist)